MKKLCARNVMALLREWSHRRLGARPGAPGAQPLLVYVLLVAAMAAAPTWAVMPAAAGSTCAKIEVNAYPIPEEQPRVAADVGRHYADRDNAINIYWCDAGLMENVPVNGLGANGNGSTKNPGDCTGNVVSIRLVARQHPDWAGSCVVDATNNDWKQSPFEAPGNATGIRRGIAVHFYGTCAPKYDWIGTSACNSSGSINSTFTASKQNRKEASGGAAGIKKVSRSIITTANSPLFHSPLNAYLPPVSATGANTATSSSTLSTANPGQRSHLCSLLTREAMTLSNRKWRLLETS